MGKLMEVTSDTFDSTINDNEVVLVDFWAPWCNPCKMLNPILEKIIDDDSINVKIVKCNTDDCPDIAQKFGISSIPTMILFKSSNEADRFVGVQPEAVIKEKLQAV